MDLTMTWIHKIGFDIFSVYYAQPRTTGPLLISFSFHCPRSLSWIDSPRTHLAARILYLHIHSSREFQHSQINVRHFDVEARPIIQMALSLLHTSSFVYVNDSKKHSRFIVCWLYWPPKYSRRLQPSKEKF